ncbi:UNVERIFIED_CONTAM: Macrophage migration inhibitory factor [Sesamum calycinum]|uniref:L-dopachrome isomerase n=1 Tax=Sesamum calycinum TaxID=2727403 RepID=A0AAW2NV70_9LAMI
MPTLNLFTNIPVDAVVASDILKDATKAVAKIIGKPESVALTTCPLYTCMIFVRVDYVMILVNGGVPISFGGTEEPAAYGELISIGGLGPSVNAKLSSTIAEILQTKLSIESSRFYIKFYDVQFKVHNSKFINSVSLSSAHSSGSMAQLFDWSELTRHLWWSEN